MDAQQRLLLEACWEALGHSVAGMVDGHVPSSTARAVGVTVGISYNEYYLNSVHQVQQVCPSVHFGACSSSFMLSFCWQCRA